MAEIRGERWHVGKELPLAVIIGFVIQIFLTGMWIGEARKELKDNSEKLKELSYQVAALTVEKQEREKDNYIINQRFQIIENELNLIKRRYK